VRTGQSGCEAKDDGSCTLRFPPGERVGIRELKLLVSVAAVDGGAFGPPMPASAW